MDLVRTWNKRAEHRVGKCYQYGSNFLCLESNKVNLPIDYNLGKCLKELWVSRVLALLENNVVDVLRRSELMVGFIIIDSTIWIAQGISCAPDIKETITIFN